MSERISFYIRLTAGILFLFCPLVITGDLISYSSLPKAAFIQLTVFILSVLSFIRFYYTSKAVYIPSYGNLFFGLFFLWAVVALTGDQFSYDGLKLFIHLGLCAILYFILSNDILNRKWAGIYFRVLFFSTLCFATIGCLQYLFDFSLFCNPEKFPSTFGNPNFAVHVLAMIIPVMAAGLFFFNDTESIIFTAVAFVISVVYLVYTASQAGLVALIVSSILIAFLFAVEIKRYDTIIKLNRLRVFLICVSFLIIAAMANLPSARTDKFSQKPRGAAAISQIYQNPVKAGSSRLKIWQNSLMIVKDYPVLGIGLDNFRSYYPLYCGAVNNLCLKAGTDMTHAHNEYIQIAAESGIPGILLFLASLGLVFFEMYRLTTKSYPSKVRLIGAGLLGGMAGFCVEAFFSFPLRLEIPPLLISFYFSVTMVLKNEKKHIAKEIKVNRQSAIGLSTVSLCLLVISGYYHTKKLRSDNYYYSAYIHTLSNQWPAALADAKKAYDINPYHFDNAVCLGRSYLENSQTGEAIHLLNSLKARYPYHLNTLLNLGIAYMQNKELDKAMDVFEQAKEVNPYSPDVDTQIANIYVLKQDYNTAYAYYSAAKDNKTKDPLVYYNLGIIEKKNKDYESAAQSYLRALRLQPGMYRINAELALLFIENLNKPQKAVPHMKRYLQYDSTSRLAWYFKNTIQSIEQSG